MTALSTIKKSETIPLPSPFVSDDKIRLSDYHMHTEASMDSEENILNTCSAAVKAGLAEIAVTDHFDCGYPECRTVLSKSYPSIEHAALEFGPQLAVKRGIEIGQATQYPDDAKFALDNYKFDFILGSMHNIRDHMDFYWMEHEDDPEELMKLYFDELIEMCENCDFDVLAHLTYPMCYKAFLGKIDITLYDKEITRIFRLLAESGRGLEINTAGLRNPAFNLLSPTAELVRLFKTLGGEIITFGSDAHKACDVGAGFTQALEAAKSAGFTQYATYTDRTPSFVKF